MQSAIAEPGQRKSYVHLLGKFVGSYRFLSCFFTYGYALREFVDFAEVVGPQLIKAGTVSELMTQVRATTVVRASVQEAGVVGLQAGSGRKMMMGGRGGAGGSPPARVSIDEMLDKFRRQFPISEEEALFIRQVTEEKAGDPGIRATVLGHQGDPIYLGEVFRKQVKALIQARYGELGRYDELTDEKIHRRRGHLRHHGGDGDRTALGSGAAPLIGAGRRVPRGGPPVLPGSRQWTRSTDQTQKGRRGGRPFCLILLVVES